MSKLCHFVAALLVTFALIGSVSASNAEDQLYEDILYFYRPEVRPVKREEDKVTVEFSASFIRLIDLDEKEQILTVNLWLEMQWTDYNLRWNPEKYDNITRLHIASDLLWTPDIVLYDNAAGDPHVTIVNEAVVYYDGTINWKPPAIYRSFCEVVVACVLDGRFEFQMNIKDFPFDKQSCKMKFGHWSNNGQTMDIIHPTRLKDDPREEYRVREVPDDTEMVMFNPQGLDMSYFQLEYVFRHNSWDVLNVTSRRHEVIYSGCCGLDYFIDITIYISLRRKPLFYFVNLVIPCMLLALMTPFVFYLPAEGHKVAFAISIMLTLMVFMQVLVDLVPAVSLSVPLMGVYLLFTMALITVSIFMSTLSLNIHHRGVMGKRASPRVRRIFLDILPKYLGVKPYEGELDLGGESSDGGQSYSGEKKEKKTKKMKKKHKDRKSAQESSPFFARGMKTHEKDQPQSVEIGDSSKFAYYRQPSPGIFDGAVSHFGDLSPTESFNQPLILRRFLRQVKFIADYFKDREEESKVADEWHYVAMVLDRICLIIFTLINIVGTAVILATPQTLWDSQEAPLPLPAQAPLGGETYKLPNVTEYFDPE